MTGPGSKKVAPRKQMEPHRKRMESRPQAPEYDLDADIIALDRARKAMEAAKSEVEVIQPRVVDGLNALGQKSVVVRQGDNVYKATMQQNTRRSIDEDKLKRKVGPSIWRRITSLHLDRNKAEALVSTGEIDPVDYADCVIESASAPFVKIT